MSDVNLLSLVTFFPLAGAVLLLAVLRGDDDAAKLNAKRFTLLTTLITFCFSLFLLTGFDASNPEFQFVEETSWLAGLS